MSIMQTRAAGGALWTWHQNYDQVWFSGLKKFRINPITLRYILKKSKKQQIKKKYIIKYLNSIIPDW